jgi:hypothetical protein
MTEALKDIIHSLGLNHTPRAVALLIIVALIYAFYKSPYTAELRSIRNFRQAGGAINSSIGMVLLLGLTIMAFALTFHTINATTLLFIILFIVIGLIVTGDFLLAISISIILSTIIIAYSTTGDYEYVEPETFKSGKGKKQETEDEADDEEDAEEYTDIKEDDTTAKYADDPEEAEQAVKKTQKSKAVAPKTAPKTELTEAEIMKEDDDEEKFVVDQQQSVLDIYKTLTGDQVKGMKKDTLDLMQTQKQLIDTLQTMGPVLEQSKGILSSFQNYFGNDEEMKTKLGQLANI